MKVCSRIQDVIGVHFNILTVVTKRKLRWYGFWHGEGNSAGDNERRKKNVRKAVEKMGKHQISRTGMGFPECSEAREMWESPRRPPRLRDWDDRDASNCDKEMIYMQYWTFVNYSPIGIIVTPHIWIYFISYRKTIPEYAKLHLNENVLPEIEMSKNKGPL